MKFKELDIEEEKNWLFMNLVASPEIAETEERLREAQELVIKGWAMALEYNDMGQMAERNDRAQRLCYCEVWTTSR